MLATAYIHHDGCCPFERQSVQDCVACVKRHAEELEAAPCNREFSVMFCQNDDLRSFIANPVPKLSTPQQACGAAQKAACGSRKGQRCLRCLRHATTGDNADELQQCTKSMNDAFCQTGVPQPERHLTDAERQEQRQQRRLQRRIQRERALSEGGVKAVYHQHDDNVPQQHKQQEDALSSRPQVDGRREREL